MSLQRTMYFILEATTLFAGCLTLTSAQATAPETIQLRGWFYFGVNSNYHAWRHGFPAGTTLVMLVSGHQDVDGFFHAQLYDEARGNINDFWTYLSYAHAECELNDDEEEISLAYMFYVCRKMNGSLIFCPKPCDASPCPVNSDCTPTQHGLFVDNYQCDCHPGYTWDTFLRDCVGSAPANATTTSQRAVNVTTGGSSVTTGVTASSVQPFSYPSSSSTTTTSTTFQSTIPPPLTWDNFTRLYTDWRHGFPPGTTLSSVLPGVVDPDDVLDNLYHRQASGNPGDFWKHMMAASTVGDLNSDHQLLSLAYIYYLCRETLSQNSECPDPCGGSPCAVVTCTVTGAGLFSNDYQCNCQEHHHWDPLLSRCVFCTPGTTWSEVRQQCVHGGATLAPTTGHVTGSATVPWSQWSPWSTCSSDCGAGIRSRRRNCRHGTCSGSRREEKKCEGNNGFWQCYGTLMYAGAAVAVALLLLLVGVLIFLATKRDEERKDGYKKLTGAEDERTHQRGPSSRRRATVKPSARRPNRQRNPKFDRPDHRRKPSPKRQPERREADRQWETRDYLSDSDQQWDSRDYPSDTEQQWESRDYLSDTNQQWGHTDYPDQNNRYYYNEYPRTEHPASYDPYRQTEHDTEHPASYDPYRQTEHDTEHPASYDPYRQTKHDTEHPASYDPTRQTEHDTEHPASYDPYRQTKHDTEHPASYDPTRQTEHGYYNWKP